MAENGGQSQKPMKTNPEIYEKPFEIEKHIQIKSKDQTINIAHAQSLTHIKGEKNSQAIIYEGRLNLVRQNPNLSENIQANVTGVEIKGSNGSQSKMVMANMERKQIEVVGVPEFTDINPISRYNFAIKLFMTDCNRIGEIELLEVWLPCALSKLYDALIYFYVRFFLTITCQLTVQCGWFISYILLALYVTLLITPITSLIILIVSGIYFLYFLIGNIVRCINQKRLADHVFHQNMVHDSNAPAFSQQYMNQFFQLTLETTKLFYATHNKMEIYHKFENERKTTFMAFRDQFIQSNYDYIVSCKMISFHIAFMIFAIAGLIISVKLFPKAYGIST